MPKGDGFQLALNWYLCYVGIATGCTARVRFRAGVRFSLFHNFQTAELLYNGYRGLSLGGKTAGA
jgi:hypothetical protein